MNLRLPALLLLCLTLLILGAGALMPIDYKLLASHSDTARGLAGSVLESLSSGGAALLGTLGTLLIAPVVRSYL